MNLYAHIFDTVAAVIWCETHLYTSIKKCEVVEKFMNNCKSICEFIQWELQPWRIFLVYVLYMYTAHFSSHNHFSASLMDYLKKKKKNVVSAW